MQSILIYVLAVHTLANTLEWDTIEIVQFDDVLLDEESSMQNDINVSTSKEDCDGSSKMLRLKMSQGGRAMNRDVCF